MHKNARESKSGKKPTRTKGRESQNDGGSRAGEGGAIELTMEERGGEEEEEEGEEGNPKARHCHLWRGGSCCGRSMLSLLLSLYSCFQFSAGFHLLVSIYRRNIARRSFASSLPRQMRNYENEKEKR